MLNQADTTRLLELTEEWFESLNEDRLNLADFDAQIKECTSLRDKLRANDDKMAIIKNYVETDLMLAKVRLDASIQGNDIESVGFNRGAVNVLQTTLFDIKAIERGNY